MLSRIRFNEKAHTYTLDGKRLQSTTEFIERYKKPFDREGIARNVARRDGRTIEEVLAEWTEKTTDGLRTGNAVHHHIAKVLKNQRNFFEQKTKDVEEEFPHANSFHEFWEKFSKHFHVHSVEKVIGDSQFGIGGTVDALLFDTRDNAYHIWDWKTNKNFNEFHPYGETLLPPFNGYSASEVNYYSLQVSLYRLILEKAMPQLKIGDSFLCHVSPDTYALYKAVDFREMLKNELSELGRDADF